MAEKTIRCRLITPEARLLNAEITHAVVTMHDGKMGFLSQRAALVGKLGAGELRLDFPEGTSKSWFVEGGFVQNVDNEIKIIAEGAIEAGDLNLEEAKAELAEAVARKPQDAAEAKKISLQRDRARAKVAMARAS